MKFLAILLAGLVLVWLVARSTGGNERVAWRTDPSAAISDAKASGKPVLLYFTASWCPPCQQMKRTTWSDQSVADALSGVVAIKVDVDSEPEISARYGVDGIPTMMVFDASGELRRSFTGGLSSEQFMQWFADANVLPTTPTATAAIAVEPAVDSAPSAPRQAAQGVASLAPGSISVKFTPAPPGDAGKSADSSETPACCAPSK